MKHTASMILLEGILFIANFEFLPMENGLLSPDNVLDISIKLKYNG